MNTKTTRTIRCPGCGGPSVYAADNPYRPFCSARCRNNDFGAWASEGYTVPAAAEGREPEVDRSSNTLPH